MVYYYEMKCHALKLVHYLLCQGHSKHLYRQNMACLCWQNMAIFTISLHFRSVCNQTYLVQHHKLECPMEKTDYCSQGQGHREDSKCQWVFVQIISSELQNILSPNLVWWCSTMSQSVMPKTLLAIFKVKVTARLHMTKVWLYLLYLQNCWFSATKLGLIIHHHKPECLMKKLNYCIQGQGHNKG